MTLAEHGSSDAPPEGTHRRWRGAWLAGSSAVVLFVVGGVAAVMTADDGNAIGTIDEYIKVVESYGPIEQTFTGEPTVVLDPTGSGDLLVSVR